MKVSRVATVWGFTAGAAVAGREKEVVFLADVMLVVAVLLGVGRIKAVTTVVEMDTARQRLRRSCMVVI